MSCPELKFYHDSGNHPRKTSCSQGYAIVPSEDTGFWCATTCLLRYFQLLIQLGMKLCSEFDMQFRLSTWRNTCRFMRSQKCQPCASPCPWSGGYLGSLDCLHTKVMGRFLSREEEKPLNWSGESFRLSHVFCMFHIKMLLFEWEDCSWVFFISRMPFWLFLTKKRSYLWGVPFSFSGEQFTKMFILCDGIYMNFSRHVKGIKISLTNIETKYTTWQEVSCEDMERTFRNWRWCGNLSFGLSKFWVWMILQVESWLHWFYTMWSSLIV